MDILQYLKNPELFVECTNCNGYGSSLKESGDVCSECGGSGCKLDKEAAIEKHYIDSGIDVPE